MATKDQSSGGLDSKRNKLSPTQTLALAMLPSITPEELKIVARKLNLDLDKIPGTSARAKIQQLLLTMEESGRLPELADVAQSLKTVANSPLLFADDLPKISRKMMDDADWRRSQNLSLFPQTLILDNPSKGLSDLDSVNYENVRRIRELQQDLATIRKQVQKVENAEYVKNEDLKRTVEEIKNSTNRAADATADLTASLIPPPPNLRRIQLIPEHLFNRLEEYNEDLNYAFLLVGTAAGAAIGIVINWLASDPLTINIESRLLLGILVVLIIIGALWLKRIRTRSNKIKRQLIDGEQI